MRRRRVARYSVRLALLGMAVEAAGAAVLILLAFLLAAAAVWLK
ncbi:MAG: hypothetical protein QJR13_01855 [Bacillota bacterium]|nr:hypothetical protein [Bacillota bacterium]